MASVLDAGERYDRPRRPTSHRRRAPRRHRRLRGPVITAVVGGLAIVTPLILRPHVDSEVALGPGSSAPVGPPPASSSGSSTPGPMPSADASSVSDSRSASPVSRDATRSSSPLAPSPTAATSAATPATTSTAAAYEAEVVTLTNNQRAAHGCPALRDDPRLRAAALGHSVDMRARNYFAHNTPDGVTPWTRIEAQGYSDPSAENIAMGQQTPQSVVDAWMNSPGHRANILNCSSKAIGVGVQFGPDGPWWTQDFGYS